MIESVAWTFAAGFLGRGLLAGPKPNLLWAAVCGLVGWLACYAIWHEALGAQGLDLFAPECFLPAIAATTILLWTIRLVIARRRRNVFF